MVKCCHYETKLKEYGVEGETNIWSSLPPYPRVAMSFLKTWAMMDLRLVHTQFWVHSLKDANNAKFLLLWPFESSVKPSYGH
jgi:hypothetical protein